MIAVVNVFISRGRCGAAVTTYAVWTGANIAAVIRTGRGDVTVIVVFLSIVFFIVVLVVGIIRF